METRVQNLVYSPINSKKLTGINGDVFNFKYQDLIIDTPSVIINESKIKISPNTPTQTPVLNFSQYKSRAVSFKYVLSKDTDTPIVCSVALQGSHSDTGAFTSIPPAITFNQETYNYDLVIPVPLTIEYEYIRLLITTKSTNKSLYLSTLYCAYPDNVPSRPNSGTISETGDTITLRMTKLLTSVAILDTTIFTLNSLTTPQVTVTVTKIEISDITVTLSISPTILKDTEFTLNYKGIGANKLTGVNGDVDSFTNCILWNRSEIT